MVPKFRAWDKETQSLRCVLVIDWLNDLVDLDSGLIERQFDEVELMQSTGLKDKKCVEVFQGDIVRCTRGCPHEVIWLKEYAGMYVGGMPAWYLSGLSEGYAWTGEEEVIGNIYDNPELLEQANEN